MTNTAILIENKKVNNFDASGILINSSIILNQNQDGNQSIGNQSIEYKVDEHTVKDFSCNPERRNIALYGTIITFIIGVLADMLGILSYFGIQHTIIPLILATALFFLLILTKRERWLAKLNDSDSAKCYRDGTWYQKLNTDSFRSFIKKAKCIYPKCSGTVHIVPAPPREIHNHTVVGKCSVGGIRHTYTVDCNGMGYPHEFDWRPPEEEKKK